MRRNLAHPPQHRLRGFTFVEAIFTIAIIGIMAFLVVSAISNAARDANRVVARQQQAAVQEALVAWVMSQTRVKVGNVETAQVQSLSAIRSSYNAKGSTKDRFDLITPKPSDSDVSARAGFLDKTTADHFLDYSTGSDRLSSASLESAGAYLTLPDWQDGDFPRVEMATVVN